MSRVPMLVMAFVLLPMLLTPASAQFIRGEVVPDGTVNLADIIATMNYLFVPGSAVPPCLDAADIDDSGALSLVDPLLLAAYLFVPGSPPPAPPFPDPGADPTLDALGDCGSGPLGFETIDQGIFSGAPEQDGIIRDLDAWQAFWQQHDPADPIPDVDFTTEMVVVVLREFSSGGYFVEIDALTAEAGDVTVEYTLASPMSFCPILLVFTQPYHIVRAPSAPGDPIPIESAADSCP